MIVRAFALAGGLAGGAALSQYPEFSQQYVQRLAGQVEALGQVAADFDASAARAGLSRQDALAEMTGSRFLEDRRRDMSRSFARFDRLSSDLAMLSVASPVERIFMPQRLGDAELLRGAWADFKPAVPLTTAGAVAAGLGFVTGWVAMLASLKLFSWPLRRQRRRVPQVTERIEPTLR